MISNRKMTRLLRHLQYRNKGRSVALDARLQLLLAPGLSTVGDCVVLTSQKNLAHANLNDFSDETGYECFVNHVHIADYISESTEPLTTLQQGLAFVDSVMAQLHRYSTAEHFNVILAFDGSDCTVRFHKARASQSWLSADLNAYEEALGVIVT